MQDSIEPVGTRSIASGLRLDAKTNGQQEPDLEKAKEIVDRATRLLLEGKESEARSLANNIWLSSSEHSLRVRAWKILSLTDPAISITPDELTIRFRSTGGRDHDRFQQWLSTKFVGPVQGVESVNVFYVPTLLTPGRASEDAIVIFVLECELAQKRLLTAIDAAHKDIYPTRDWRLITERAIEETSVSGKGG